jgi:GLPGLI family protein
MKKIVLLILITSFKMNSQTIKITYEERANIENQLKNEKDPEIRKMVAQDLSTPIIYNLIISKDQSIYFKQANNAKKKNADIDNKGDKTIELGNINGGLYKNYTEKTYLNESNIFGKEFLIKDKIEQNIWKITKETKKIGEYNCKKATTIINGKAIEAWFTDKISISNGPSNFGGLPGLILELKAEMKTYVAIKIEQLQTTYTFVKPSKGKIVTQKVYDKTLEETLNDFKSGNGNLLIGE